MMNRKIALLGGLILFVTADTAWAKPKSEIVVEVVSIVEALRHSPSYHPAVPDTSTTICSPDRVTCTITTVPGHQASIDNLEYYSQFIYVITPKGEHFMLRHAGSTVVYPPAPGRYTAATDDDKVLVLYVNFVNGRSGKLKYRIEGIWPGI